MPPVVAVRKGLRFESALESNCAPLAGLVEAMLAAGAAEVHRLRNLTRSGLAAALNEIASDARVGVEIDESAVPVTEPVASAYELLGLDPLYVANEGRLVAFVSSASADRVLAAMQAHPAAITPVRIGVVTSSHAGLVELCGPSARANPRSPLRRADAADMLMQVFSLSPSRSTTVPIRSDQCNRSKRCRIRRRPL